MRLKLTILGIASLFLVSGCGGGGSSPGSEGETPGSTEFASGNFTGRAASTNPPVTTAAGVTVATGVTGSFTALRLRDSNVDISDSRIATASRKTTGGDIYTSNIDGSNLFRVTSTTNLGEEEPAWNSSGTKLAFNAFDGSFFRDIYIYRYDGLFLTRVTNTPSGDEHNPEWSPDGTKLMYDRGAALFLYDIAGALESPINAGGNAFDVSWSPANKLAFVTTRSGNADVFISNADGSSPTGALGGTSADPESLPAWAPDGETLYFVRHSGTDYHIIRYQQSFWYGSADTIHTTTESISGLDVSSDGEFVGFQTANGIYRIPQHGGTSPVLMIDPQDLYQGFSWGPMLTDRFLIGSGGLFASAAAGFIYADAAAKTQSVLAFDCVTKSSAILRAQTGLGGSQDSLVFFLDADTVNMVKFANSPDWLVRTSVGSGTSVPTANGALISIDAVNGRVNSVLPFTGTRGVNSKPTITREGSNYVFTGQFLSAIDGSGKNVATTGASRVVLDPKTGTLTAE